MVAFLVAKQNMMYGHMIGGGGGLKLFRILEGYRQYIDRA